MIYKAYMNYTIVKDGQFYCNSWLCIGIEVNDLIQVDKQSTLLRVTNVSKHSYELCVTDAK